MHLSDHEKELVSQLKKGDKKKIAEKLNMHVNSISQILKGSWHNENVWLEVLSIVERRQELESKKKHLASFCISK